MKYIAYNTQLSEQLETRAVLFYLKKEELVLMCIASVKEHIWYDLC